MSKVTPLLSGGQVDLLVSRKTISLLPPWESNDEDVIEEHLREVCKAIEQGADVESKIEWNHYGSGYASFVDAWFYRRAPDFRPKNPLRYGEEHTGLAVLLSRLSPYFVFMEAEKRWHRDGSSSYLPEFEMVDQLHSQGVIRLAIQVQGILEERGLVRVHKEQLANLLSPEIQIETNLSSGALKQFDALYHWFD